MKENSFPLLGMSALLTTTMPYMKVVIDTLSEKGLRDDYIVLVGGAPLHEAFAEAVAADAYSRDAARLMAETLAGMPIQRVFVVHGEPSASAALAERLVDDDVNAVVPTQFEVVRLD